MKIRLLIATILTIGMLSTVAFADASDNPGQEIDNPWAHLFTTTPSEQTTPSPAVETTDSIPSPVPAVRVPDKVKVKKAVKKKSAKKVKVTLKKIKGSNGYQVAVYKSKKNAKKDKKALVKKYTTKTKVVIKSKKLKKKKKLFVRARAYILDGKTKYYSPWSKTVKVKIKK